MSKTKKKATQVAPKHPLIKKYVTTSVPAFNKVYIVGKVSSTSDGLIAYLVPLGRSTGGHWVPVSTLQISRDPGNTN